jgi:enamine deaminase RidA (YjgF/YER057c/UK114 family)
MSTVQDRLLDMGLQLPVAPKPVAAYLPAVRLQRPEALVYVSGQIPLVDGQLVMAGRVPDVVSLEEASQAAQICVLNGLAVLADVLDGDLERVQRVVRLGVFVASAPSFTDQPRVANGASELLQKVLGENGRHARAAVGAVSLPMGAPVEVEMTVAVAAG